TRTREANTDIIAGPRNRPSGPYASSPPRIPRNSAIVGRPVPCFIASGLTKLSMIASAIEHQMTRPTAADQPDAKPRYSVAGIHTSAVPPMGISPAADDAIARNSQYGT